MKPKESIFLVKIRLKILSRIGFAKRAKIKGGF